ncbi:DUF7716 domain-containing protein [Janthinobacterium sp. RB2R34]|uniref:DUF7716 domain-containing protein n=1 Tax=Janthinobacterium sp. RB2R34 TaxID=3424193 RepID=UPI003F27475C
MKLDIGRSYGVKELVEIVKNKADRDFDQNGKERYIPENLYDVYIAENEELNANSMLYVGPCVEIDANDNKVYPDHVLKNHLEFHYSCQNFQDVIDLAYSQKNDASIDEFVSCLNHYSENDDFLDLDHDGS